MAPMGFDERVACQGADIDFTTLHRRSNPEVLAQARKICSECPALFACLTYLETTEVAGLAAGMTAEQRRRWRRRDGREVDDVTIMDVSEAAELTGPIIEDLQIRLSGPRTQLTDEAVRVVYRMTEAGFSAGEIVERLGRDDLTMRAVAHIRHKFFDDGVTAQRKQEVARQRALRDE